MDDMQRAWRDAERVWKQARRTRARSSYEATKRIQRMYMDAVRRSHPGVASKVIGSQDGESILFLGKNGLEEVPVSRLEAAGAGWVGYLEDVLGH